MKAYVLVDTATGETVSGPQYLTISDANRMNKLFDAGNVTLRWIEAFPTA
jgi:hypothetical protein